MREDFAAGATLLTQHSDKRTLLIVDDQPINIQLLSRAFSADYHLIMAASGQQALHICHTHPPDLILLDIEMPEMNGFEVCRHLKAHADTRNIPVIFVTAHIDEQTETRGLQAGAVDFITRPINFNIVRARVNTHLTLKIQSDFLRQLAWRDGLTGAYNRRYFDEHLALEWHKACQQHIPLSLVILDVDVFKDYNDRYGHQQGDECLRKVAAAINPVLKRPGDMLARYGGEEFVCLLPNTVLSGALSVAESIRNTILALQIEHHGSPVTSFVTVSAGVCCKEAASAGNCAELFRQADEQLYLAKQHGRNQCFATPLTPAATPPKSRGV